MMVRAFRGLVAATVLVAAVATTAEAQASSSRFGINAGIALPMGDFGDAVGMGIHAGGHFSMGLSGNLGLRINADYGRYSGEDGTGIDNVTFLGGVANLVYNINTSSGLKPYIFGGLGFYNWKVDPFDVSESDLAFNVGAGYDFTLGSAKMFTEVRYLSIQSEGEATNTLPIVIGIRF